MYKMLTRATTALILITSLNLFAMHRPFPVKKDLGENYITFFETTPTSGRGKGILITCTLFTEGELAGETFCHKTENGVRVKIDNSNFVRLRDKYNEQQAEKNK